MNIIVGKYGQLIRIIVGLAIITWGVYTKNWWGAVGAIPLLSINWFD